MKIQLFFLCLLSGLLLTYGCGNTAQEENNQEDSSSTSEADSPEEAAKQLEEAMESFAKQGEGKEIVNFRELKELMPEKLTGLPKTQSGGETSGIANLKISTAEATYEKEDERLTVNITDTGGFGVAIMSMAAWSKVEVDRENEDGYERTTTIDGYKAFEKFDSKRKRAELAVIVNDRYIVALEGRNMDFKDLRKAFKGIPVKKLN